VLFSRHAKGGGDITRCPLKYATPGDGNCAVRSSKLQNVEARKAEPKARVRLLGRGTKKIGGMQNKTRLKELGLTTLQSR